MANILTLAAYEQARRALRGECEPNSRQGKERTNISDKQSANIARMREVGSRPRRLRQNEKRPSKTVFLVEAVGKRKKFNVYAKTREECEKLLAEMIEKKKVEIAEMKKKQKRYKRTEGRPRRSPLNSCGAKGKDK